MISRSVRFLIKVESCLKFNFHSFRQAIRLSNALTFNFRRSDSLPLVLIIISLFRFSTTCSDNLLNVQVLYQLFGLYEFLPHRNVERWLGKHICGRCNTFKCEMEQTIYLKRFSIEQNVVSESTFDIILPLSILFPLLSEAHPLLKMVCMNNEHQCHEKCQLPPLGVHEHWLLPSWFHP